MSEVLSHRPVIVGGGLAGLLTALHLAPRPCLVLTAGDRCASTSSSLAQGGIAAALGPDDSPAAHAADTVAAGAGLSDPDLAARVTRAAPEAVEHLRALGARFDMMTDGEFALALEGAHSHPRIAHAGGDATGAELLRTVLTAVRRCPSIEVLENTQALRVITDDGEVSGVVVHPSGRGPTMLPTTAVILATGGVGGLFRHTTNPTSSRGQGLALAARAGADLRDLEMIQFHPTALDVGRDPMPLVTEAVRGAGARVVDQHGQDLTDPLATRDAVSRAVWLHLQATGRAFLDVRQAGTAHFADRFPSVLAACRSARLDPARDLIPVRPAAHYHMGGVAVDDRGRSSVPGLWAVGEVASTGLHGANRLASNSLLEAAVYARWVARDLIGSYPRDTLGLRKRAVADRPAPEDNRSVFADRAVETGGLELGQIRDLVSGAVGVLRDRVILSRATSQLQRAYAATPENDDVLVSLFLATSALRRHESRGAHTRTDLPFSVEPKHLILNIAGVLSEDSGLERSAS